ncbi:hypothetical protein EON66_02365, partial [archaeon]
MIDHFRWSEDRVRNVMNAIAHAASVQERLHATNSFVAGEPKPDTMAGGARDAPTAGSSVAAGGGDEDAEWGTEPPISREVEDTTAADSDENADAEGEADADADASTSSSAPLTRVHVIQLLLHGASRPVLDADTASAATQVNVFYLPPMLDGEETAAGTATATAAEVRNEEARAHVSTRSADATASDEPLCAPPAATAVAAGGALAQQAAVGDVGVYRELMMDSQTHRQLVLHSHAGLTSKMLALQICMRRKRLNIYLDALRTSPALTVRNVLVHKASSMWFLSNTLTGVPLAQTAAVASSVEADLTRAFVRSVVDPYHPHVLAALNSAANVASAGADDADEVMGEDGGEGDVAIDEAMDMDQDGAHDEADALSVANTVDARTGSDGQPTVVRSVRAIIVRAVLQQVAIVRRSTLAIVLMNVERQLARQFPRAFPNTSAHICSKSIERVLYELCAANVCAVQRLLPAASSSELGARVCLHVVTRPEHVVSPTEAAHLFAEVQQYHSRQMATRWAVDLARTIMQSPPRALSTLLQELGLHNSAAAVMGIPPASTSMLVATNSASTSFEQDWWRAALCPTQADDAGNVQESSTSVGAGAAAPSTSAVHEPVSGSSARASGSHMSALMSPALGDEWLSAPVTRPQRKRLAGASVPPASTAFIVASITPADATDEEVVKHKPNLFAGTRAAVPPRRSSVDALPSAIQPRVIPLAPSLTVPSEPSGAVVEAVDTDAVVNTPSTSDAATMKASTSSVQSMRTLPLWMRTHTWTAYLARVLAAAQGSEPPGVPHIPEQRMQAAIHCLPMYMLPDLPAACAQDAQLLQRYMDSKASSLAPGGM